jgi:hypothetical protein
MNQIIVISQSQKIREFLKTKLAQYVERIFDNRESEDVRQDAYYKAALVQHLLTYGEIGFAVEQIVIHRLTGKLADPKAFTKAWEVIEDYNRTGGSNTLQRADQTVHVQ